MLDFRTSATNSIPHANTSLCLITAAQAAHWFDLKQFYSEVHRTLKPMGVVAVYGYGLPDIAGKHAGQLNPVFQNVG